MKKLIYLLLALFSISVYGQTDPYVVPAGAANQVTKYKGGVVLDSILQVPVRNNSSNYPGLSMKGRIQINKQNNKFYYHDGTSWVLVSENIIANVKDYGAKGDGTTDDTNNILAAINTDKKIIYFPSGTYMTKNVLYKAGQEFVGQNRETTIIKWIPNSIGTGSDNLISRMVKGNSVVSASFRDLTFNGNKATNGRYKMTSLFGDNIKFENCNFTESGAAAIDYTGNGNLIVKGCKFEHGEFLGNIGETTQYILITKSTLNPASLPTYKEVLIEGNYFHSDAPPSAGKATGGIFVTGASNTSCPVVIRNNIFDGLGAFNGANYYGAIYLYDHADNTIIENNRIFNRRYTGISVANSFNFTIENNYIVGVDDDGFYVSDDTPAAININQGTNGNVVDKLSAKITGNTIKDCEQTAAINATGVIDDGELDGLWINENFIENAAIGIYVKGFKSAHILNNKMNNVGLSTFGNFPIWVETGFTGSSLFVQGNIIDNSLAGTSMVLENLNNTDINVSGNKINNVANIGIRAINFKNLNLYGNTVINSPVPYQVQTGAVATVYGNITNELSVSLGSGVSLYKEGVNSWNSDYSVPTIDQVLGSGNTSNNKNLIFNTSPDANGIYLANANNLRWIMRTTGAETGSNSGSDFILQGRGDVSGAGDWLKINRATGLMEVQALKTRGNIDVEDTLYMGKTGAAKSIFFRRSSDGAAVSSIGYPSTSSSSELRITSGGGGGFTTVYQNGSEVLRVSEKANVWAKSFTNLANQRWCIFGDSFSNDIDFDYPKIVRDNLDLIPTDYAVSGNKLSQQLVIVKSIVTSNPNYFQDFDIVSLHIGANDYAADNVPLGTVDSAIGSGTFAGDLKDFIETVLTSNPKVKLFIITPPEANGQGVPYKGINSMGWGLNDLAILESNICVDYSVQCIDLYSIAQFNLKTIPFFTADLLHPNSAEGVKWLGNIVSQAFLSNNNKGRTVDFRKLQQSLSNTVNLTGDQTNIDGIKGFKQTIRIQKDGATKGVEWYSGTTKEAEILQNSGAATLTISSGRNVGWGGKIIFSTDTTEKARIESNGNLLVGTTTDTGEKAQINGEVKVGAAVAATSAMQKQQVESLNANNVKTTNVDQNIDGNKSFTNSPNIPAGTNGFNAINYTQFQNALALKANLSGGNSFSGQQVIDKNVNDALPVVDIRNSNSASTGDILRILSNIGGTVAERAKFIKSGQLVIPDATDNTQATTLGQVNSLLTPKANTASPTFTGDPKGPTPIAGDNDTSLATTEFVNTYFNQTISKDKNTTITASGTTSSTVLSTWYGTNGVAMVFVNAAGGATTINLEAAAAMEGKTVYVIKTDSSVNAVTVQGNGATNINGSNTYLLTSQYQNVTIKSNGTQYYILD